MISVRKAKTLSDFIDAVRLRAQVFIVEKGFAPGWEPDEDDKKATHFIASSGGKAVGTCRLRQEKPRQFKIERLAVAKEFRKHGAGKALVKAAVREALKKKPKRVWARCYRPAQKFWESCGFVVASKPYGAYGKKHIDLKYPV